MKPVVALVGRPNVGKSTLFNQLTRSRDALVADHPGLTRDRKYGEGKLGEKPFIVIDTGGIGENDDGIDQPMTEQAISALDEATDILFLVDGRAGCTPADLWIAQQLRERKKNIVLVVNKTDGVDADVAVSDFYQMGFDRVYAIAASHGRGVRSMIEVISDDWQEPEALEEQDAGIKVAIIGRPNVGKSTLVNRIMGEERVVVYDMAGTTRDSIYIPFERQDQKYTLIDTAGVRRRGRIDETVEKFSVVKALQAIQDAHVVILVVDAREGLVDQDLSLLGFVLDAGRSLMIAVNKWDGLESDERARIKEDLKRRLEFVNYARVHTISALHGTGIGDLYGFVQKAYRSAFGRLSSNKLTQILEAAVTRHQPPMVNRHRIKLRYAHMGGSNPPVIVIHGNQAQKLPTSYQRYLEKTYRQELKLEGTPVRLELKSSENPYKDKKNTLTQRQQHKKRRLMKHNKKRK